MRLWENRTNFYLFMFLNFLEIPRTFLKASLRSSSKVWNSYKHSMSVIMFQYTLIPTNSENS